MLHRHLQIKYASIAQMVERKTLNLVVVGSIPTGGDYIFLQDVFMLSNEVSYLFFLFVISECEKKIFKNKISSHFYYSQLSLVGRALA